MLAGGGGVLAAALLAVLGVLAWRSVRPPGDAPAARASSVAAAAAAAGLPVSAVVGTREALERGAGRRPVPVLATLAGSVVAVMAVTMAVVFGASLTGLVANPARYGWNWTLLMDTQGGYGSWPPSQMDRLVSGQPGVTGWSTFAFTQIPIDGQSVPVLGLTRHLGSVEPPTTSGHPIAGPRQIELGVATLRQLGKRIGDTVTVGSGRDQAHAHHRGHGDAAVDRADPGRPCVAGPRRHARRQHAAGHSGPSREPAMRQQSSCAGVRSRLPLGGGDRPGARRQRQGAGRQDQPTPIPAGPRAGPTSCQPNRIRGAAIVDAAQMGSQPLTLALALAAGAVLSLALALLASVRRRRRELALLKTLGLTRRQVMAAVAWQASVILVIAALIGVPLGVPAGHWAWAAFATSLGAVPVTVVPVPALLAGIVVLLVAGNLLAAGPGAVAARTPPAAVLRAE